MSTVNKQHFNRVVSRLPPEPNDFLHSGYSKAIIIMLSLVNYHGNVVYISYDVINLTNEEDKYFTTIAEIIQ
jgi:glutaminyl-tRNA synthetase